MGMQGAQRMGDSFLQSRGMNQDLCGYVAEYVQWTLKENMLVASRESFSCLVLS